MEKLAISNSISVHASSAKVWEVLTAPEQTKKYMFGCVTISDWKEGSPLLWQGSYEGREMVFVKGNILQIDPYHLLKYSVIDPNVAMEDIPENYLHVTYTLIEDGDKTLLTVVQDHFEGAADAEKRYQDSNNNGDGWNPILLQIKEIAEA